VIDSAIPFDQQAYADWEMVTRAVMTAEPSVIARAACKALGIEVSE
jgi:formate dehydrogenase assembly factor FdhD